MTLFAYLLIGSVVAYGVFTILMELSGEIRYVRIDDDRDTEEKVIAGEETSEVALNYLKIAASLEDDDEAR
jgi:uncharacterized membrane protein